MPIAMAPPPGSFPQASRTFLNAQGNVSSPRAWPVVANTHHAGVDGISRAKRRRLINQASRNSRPSMGRLRLCLGQPSFLYSLGFGTTDGMGRFDLDTTKAQQMKILSTLPLLVVIASAGLSAPAFAGEEAATSATAVKEDTATDCSKQVWPHFTPTCLRNDQATVVRVVTANRR